MTGDVPTLWLVEPKQKQKPENEKAIEEFCGKLREKGNNEIPVCC